MGLIVLTSVLFIVALIILFVGCKDWDNLYHKTKEKEEKKHKENEDKTKEFKYSLKTRLLSFFYFNDDEIKTFGVIASIILGFVLFIMVDIIIDNHTNAPAELAKANETYAALCYKAESEYARDEFGLINKEIVDEIQDWNEEIVYNREMRNHPWVGIFYSKIYDEIPIIDFKTLK